MHTLTVLATQDKRTKSFSDYCLELSKSFPGTECIERQAEGLPGILIMDNLIYRGLPGGREREPFLDALALAGKGAQDFPGSRAVEIDIPSSLMVFVTNECPVCPAVVRSLISIAMANQAVSVTVVDARLFPELAQQARIRSVPTIMLDGEIRWIGGVGMNEVLEALLSRDASRISRESLEGLLKDGRAGMVAEKMAKLGLVFPALLDIILSESWPLRMGAMVALEELSGLSPKLAASAVERLLGSIAAAPDTVKGDILYLAGEIGGEGAVAGIKGVLSNSCSEEVMDAGREAVEKILSRRIKDGAGFALA